MTSNRRGRVLGPPVPPWLAPVATYGLGGEVTWRYVGPGDRDHPGWPVWRDLRARYAGDRSPDPSPPDPGRAARLLARWPIFAGEAVAAIRAARKAAKASERARVADRSEVEDLRDLGPIVMRDDGRVEVLDVVEADDPDDATSRTRRIRRASRVWAPDRLYRAGAIASHELSAANAYLADYEVGMLGARVRSNPLARWGGHGPGGATGPSDYQLHALASYERALRDVGSVFEPVLAVLVLAHGTIEAFAAANRMNPTEARGWFRAALARLAESYRMAPPAHGQLRAANFTTTAEDTVAA